MELVDDHTYYVGENGVLVHNKCKVAKNKVGTEGRKAGEYNTFYKHKLSEGDYLKSDSVQFRKANKSLLVELDNNPKLRKDLLSSRPEMKGWIDSPNLSNSPTEFTWHHYEEEGIRRLVDRADHSRNFSIYHPTGKGG